MATVSAHHVLSSMAGAINQGHSAEVLLKTAGINPQIRQLPNGRVSDNQMSALVQLIWRLLDDEFMGFTESPCKRGAFAFMLQSIRRCENLREALVMGMRFYSLMTDDIHTELSESGDVAVISIIFRVPKHDECHFFHEFWMVIWHRLASWLTGVSIPLLEADFVQMRSAHAVELMTMFPCQHRFEAERSRLVFHKRFLNNSLVRSKAEIDSFLSHSPYNLLTIPGDDPRLKGRITKLITLSSSNHLEFPALPDLARDLNLSVQTLHRRLMDEGTSYQRIKDEMRRDLALSQLAKDKLRIYQVAQNVGFADARSFTRAFKTWTGMTPREYCRFV